MRPLAFVFPLAIVAIAAFAPGDALASEPPPELLADIDAQFTRRDDAAELKALEKRLESSLASSPDSFELLWRDARLKLWVAEGNKEGAREKALVIAARQRSERAAKLRPERVEGHFYAAAAIGIYSQSVGIVKAIAQGLEGKFNGYLDKALAIDADFEQGGPRLAKGRYHYELPWPKRDLRRSRELLFDVVRRHPERLRGRVYLAETLLADDQAKLAARELEALKATPVGVDPPEDRRMRAWAKGVEVKVREELD